MIKFYQFFISPLLGSNCRFYPTCSEYAKEALNTYGFFKGLLLTIYRLARCQPFSKGGVDSIKK